MAHETVASPNQWAEPNADDEFAWFVRGVVC